MMRTSPDTGHDLTLVRARFCYTEVANWPERLQKDGNSKAQGLPVQVRTQGLLTSVAVLTGGDEVANRFADTLARWLLAEWPHRSLEGAWERPVAADLLGALAQASRAEHIAAQREAILMLDQIKIFAKALHGRKDAS